MIEYIILFGFVFLLNANPFFTLPTWVATSLFLSYFNLPMLESVFVGVTASAFGRITLSLYSRSIADKFLPERQKRSITFIRKFMRMNGSNLITFFISLLYALSPLPTNAIFIIAGVAQLKLPMIVFGFFLGELLSNILYVEIVREFLTLGGYFLIGVAGLAVAIAILFVDWEAIIKGLIKKEMKKLK